MKYKSEKKNAKCKKKTLNSFMICFMCNYFSINLRFFVLEIPPRNSNMLDTQNTAPEPHHDSTSPYRTEGGRGK